MHTSIAIVSRQSNGFSYCYVTLIILKKKKGKVGDPKALFSIATTPKYGRGCSSLHGLLHFTLDLYLKMLSVKQGDIKYHFYVSSMTRPVIEPRHRGPVVNTLTIMLMSGNIILFNINYLFEHSEVITSFSI